MGPPPLFPAIARGDLTPPLWIVLTSLFQLCQRRRPRCNQTHSCEDPSLNGRGRLRCHLEPARPSGTNWKEGEVGREKSFCGITWSDKVCVGKRCVCVWQGLKQSTKTKALECLSLTVKFAPTQQSRRLVQDSRGSQDEEGDLVPVPNHQQRTLHKLPTTLQNIVNNHRLSIQIGAKRAKTCTFRLSFNFARHRWWLGTRCKPGISLVQHRRRRRHRRGRKLSSSKRHLIAAFGLTNCQARRIELSHYVDTGELQHAVKTFGVVKFSGLLFYATVTE